MRRDSNTCILCHDPDCKVPMLHATFLDHGVMYPEPGTTTRLADVKGRTSTNNPGHQTRRKIIDFMETWAVVHLGDATPREAEDSPPFSYSTENAPAALSTSFTAGGIQSTRTGTMRPPVFSDKITQFAPSGAKGLVVLRLLCFIGGCCVWDPPMSATWSTSST